MGGHQNKLGLKGKRHCLAKQALVIGRAYALHFQIKPIAKHLGITLGGLARKGHALLGPRQQALAHLAG